MKVSKKQAINARTGKLKKGYKATKSGYYKVSSTKAKPKSKAKTKRKTGVLTKIKRACKKLTK